MIIIYQNRGLLRLDANHSHPNQIIWLQHCVSFNWTSYPHSHYNTWILSVISSRNCAHMRLIAGVSWVVFSIGCFWRERKSANKQCYLGLGLGLGIQCQMLPHLSNSSYQLIRYIIKARISTSLAHTDLSWFDWDITFIHRGIIFIHRGHMIALVLPTWYTQYLIMRCILAF